MRTAQNEVIPEGDSLMDFELELAKRIKQPQPEIGGQSQGRVTGQRSTTGNPLVAYFRSTYKGITGRQGERGKWGPLYAVPYCVTPRYLPRYVHTSPRYYAE